MTPWLLTNHAMSEQRNESHLICCTSNKFHYLINFTIFTEDALNLICVKYYEIGIKL